MLNFNRTFSEYFPRDNPAFNYNIVQGYNKRGRPNDGTERFLGIAGDASVGYDRGRNVVSKVAVSATPSRKF